MSGRPPVTAVFFDVGETLIDESTEYHAWADWLGVPRHTFSAVFGQTLARGQGYRQVFHRFRPGFDLVEEHRRRAAAGLAEHVDGRDLYPDVRDCLTRLRAAGYVVGVAGNQTARAGRLLGELNLPTDLVATSADWGVEKPDPAFFATLAGAAGRPPAEILYVGDRLDNDIRPAARAGLRTAFVCRGPWGYLYADDEGLAIADLHLTGLAELPDRLPMLTTDRREHPVLPPRRVADEAVRRTPAMAVPGRAPEPAGAGREPADGDGLRGRDLADAAGGAPGTGTTQRPPDHVPGGDRRLRR